MEGQSIQSGSYSAVDFSSYMFENLPTDLRFEKIVYEEIDTANAITTDKINFHLQAYKTPRYNI
jgi:hypothetical protein